MMSVYHVTLLDAGVEITVEVSAHSKDGARAEARRWHPNGHIVHVERAS